MVGDSALLPVPRRRDQIPPSLHNDAAGVSTVPIAIRLIRDPGPNSQIPFEVFVGMATGSHQPDRAVRVRVGRDDPPEA